MNRLKTLAAATLALGWSLGAASAFELGVIGFQFSSETHARVANAAAAAAKARGWNVTLLNSEGALPKHAEQFEALIAKKVDAIAATLPEEIRSSGKLVVGVNLLFHEPSPALRGRFPTGRRNRARCIAFRATPDKPVVRAPAGL